MRRIGGKALAEFSPSTILTAYAPSMTIIVKVLRTLSSFRNFHVTISLSFSMLSAYGATA
ncbi:MAG: hypothetical protein QW220_03485 [Candidatus Bathyarchaeia archaeon]